MYLFQIDKPSGNFSQVKQANFQLEKDLQNLVEKNLEAVFNCRFVASEFYTGNVHGGKIDTLGLSEENNPVIIEYKKVVSSSLITQSLYYLAWIQDHKGDFELATNAALGSNTIVDWSEIRVICLAPDYRKYDLHAAQVMNTAIELWKYRQFENGSLLLEPVYQELSTKSTKKGQTVNLAGLEPESNLRSDPIQSWSIDYHLNGKSDAIKHLFTAVQDFILELDSAIEAVPKKMYVAYRIAQNIVCIEIGKSNLRLFVKLSAGDIQSPPATYTDVTNLGHHGTGDSKFTIASREEFEQVKPFIQQAYNAVGA